MNTRLVNDRPESVWFEALEPPAAVCAIVEKGEEEMGGSEVEAAWRRLQRENDALFDGPILRVVGVDARRSEVRCCRSRFRLLATADLPGLGNDGFRQLGVSGVVIGMDAAGQERLLIGRRSSRTRIYAGLWENAPSGGVSIGENTLRDGQREVVLDARALYSALCQEAVEEIGDVLPTWDAAQTMIEQRGAIECVGLLHDAIARSVDVVMRVHVGRIGRQADACRRADQERWEYVDRAWVTRGEISEMWKGGLKDGVFSPPTVVAMAATGWTASA